jgi:hypothetical protein
MAKRDWEQQKIGQDMQEGSGMLGAEGERTRSDQHGCACTWSSHKYKHARPITDRYSDGITIWKDFTVHANIHTQFILIIKLRTPAS